jgi:hypothetical protein
MIRVWDLSQHEGSHLLALLALADWANADGLCWPKVSKLAKRARVGERQAQFILADLSESGELYIQRGTGRGNKSHYVVLTGMDESLIAAVLVHHLDLTPLEAQTIAKEKVQQSSPFSRGDAGPSLESAQPRAERVQRGSPFSKRKGEVQRQERVKSSAKTQAVQGVPMQQTDLDPNVDPKLKEPPLNHQEETPPDGGGGGGGFLRMNELRELGYNDADATAILAENPEILPADIRRCGPYLRALPASIKYPRDYLKAILLDHRLPFEAGKDEGELAAEQAKRDAATKANDAARFTRSEPQPAPSALVEVPTDFVKFSDFAAMANKLRQSTTMPRPARPPNPYQSARPPDEENPYE